MCRAGMVKKVSRVGHEEFASEDLSMDAANVPRKLVSP